MTRPARGRRAWGLVLVAAVLTAAPGTDATAEGSSLFRSLLAPSGHVPFPLSRLLDRLRGEIASGSEFDGLPLVLIPLGRSLQRHAAGDLDYFRYPRVVVAVTGGPRDVRAPLLRDRLYLGYHEKAGVLEVISYDPQAGRFEFEVVDDYRAGAEPRLRAGNRALCIACHQNEAPIFSRQTWDETSASPAIAALLALSGKDFYGLDWQRGVDVANAIDEATDRANLLSTAQRIWREGCGSGDAGVRCRGRLLWLTLRSRLSGVPAADRDADDAALQPLAAAWTGVWHDELAIPNPDLPNRLPFAGAAPGNAVADPAALRRIADVAARFDALELRPPIERWRADQPGHFGRMVQALGEFFPDADLAALATRLAETGAGAHRALALACRRDRRADREDYRCGTPGGVELAARRSGTRILVDRIVFETGEVRYGLEFEGAGARLSPRGAAARNGSGERLAEIVIAGDSLHLHLTDDLGPLREAISALAAATLAGHADGLSDAPLRRWAVLAPLFAALGLTGPSPPAPAAPTADAARLPSAREADPALAPFVRYCGTCHDGPDAFPPAFLRGDPASVRARLDACAPRMLQRLAMWDAAPAERRKSPMPPPAAPQAASLRASADFGAMRGWLVDRLRVTGHDPAAILRQTYADLPGCAIH